MEKKRGVAAVVGGFALLALLVALAVSVERSGPEEVTGEATERAQRAAPVHIPVVHEHAKKPTPRRLKAELDAEKARIAAELGPATTYGKMMKEPGPDGRTFVLLPNGHQWFGQPGDHERKAPWLMARTELYVKRPDIESALSDHVDHQEHRYCAREIYARGPLARPLAWSLALRLSAQGGEMVIDEVEPIGDGWPPEVTEADRECYVASFRGHTIPWPHTESLWVDFHIVLQASRGGSL